VLDALDAVASALANLDEEAQNLSVTAASAAHLALDRLRSQVCRVGRARMFPQKSSGSDDPGMLAFTLLLDSLSESTSSPTTN